MKMAERLFRAIILVGVIMIGACSWIENSTELSDEDTNSDEENFVDCDTVIYPTLPPKTQQGLNTAGCKINGKNWRPRMGKPWTDTSFSSGVMQVEYGDIGTNPNNPIFSIRLNRWFQHDCDTIMQNISFSSLNVHVGDKCLISNDRVYNDNRNCGEFSKIPDENNYLIIDYLDTVDRVIAGRFGFVAVNNCISEWRGRDTVVATDGRFDIEYVEHD